MRNIHDIIEEYRQSDLLKRIDLFLEFRELRGEFSEIDRKEGFIGIKDKTDAVPSYLTKELTAMNTFLSHLKALRHRFRKCIQGSP